MSNPIVSIIELLISESLFAQFMIFVIGMIIGSFINVVIYRLPKMMEFAYGHHSEKNYVSSVKFNLISPSSCCPHCHHKISPIENIPVFSFIWLRGKCRHCKKSISLRYPMVELLCGLITVLCFSQYGYSVSSLAACIFVYALITLSLIDLDSFLLPDSITLPLVWLGLIVNLNAHFADIHSAVLGAILGYLILWSLYWLFKFFTKKHAMGYGDFKLLAAVGAWLGWQSLANVILVSSLTALLTFIVISLFYKMSKDTPIPFGPFIAFAAIVQLFLL